MSEVAAPLGLEARARLRYSRLVGLHAQAARLGLQIRQETAALVEEDTAFAQRGFVADELSMALSESSLTCKRWVEDARLTVAHERLMAHVAASVEAALAAGVAGRVDELSRFFGLRHADAVLDELAGASAQLQDQVLDLVLADEAARTPHQLRKATRAARMLLDLAAEGDKQDRIHDRRSVRVFDELDGSASLLVNGRKTGAAALLAAIDAHVAVPVPGDTRTLGQRRYDWLMDLVCGRVQPTASWQALIVVSLETLQGDDAPAELPELGLVSAEEAREVLAQAELRRAVVDAHGQLVALDDVVLRGDQTPLAAALTPAELSGAVAAAAAAAAALAAGDGEPQELADAEPAASAQDWAWLADQVAPDMGDQECLAARQELAEARLLLLCDAGMAAIEAYLCAQSLAAHGLVRGLPTHDDQAGEDPDSPEPPEGGPEPPRGGSGSGPRRPGPVRPGGDGQGSPDQPPPHDEPAPHDLPPSWADRDWLECQEDAAAAVDCVDAHVHADRGCLLREATDPVAWAPSRQAQAQRQQRLRRQALASRWTTVGLQEAVTRLRTAPPNPLPPASKGYPFRGRLARWIKTRDITCVFPGCTLQAQRCQLDHLVEHPRGKTEHCNGACECTHHHQCKHACMTVARLPDGSLRWTNRHGLTVDRPPRPLLRGW